MKETEVIDLLVEIFGWDATDQHARFEALRTLRSKRGEPEPNWDDFNAGTER